jgi:hypothetical protein
MGVDRPGISTPAKSSALSAPSTLETLEIGATEPISAQIPRIAHFAKKVLGLPPLPPAGSVVVTCYWSPGADAAESPLRHASAERRAGEALSALMIFGIPAEEIRASASDASLLSPPAPPSGLVRITFFPDQSPFTPSINMFQKSQPMPNPGGKQGSIGLTGAEIAAYKDLPSASNAGAPRAGTTGDLAKAFLAYKPVKKAVHETLDNLFAQFQNLDTGDQVVTVVLGAELAAYIVALDPAAINLLDGAQLEVPGLDGLEVEISTKGSLGAILKIDVLKLRSQWKERKKKHKERAQPSLDWW